MKIVHIINNLGDGGAERTLVNLVTYSKSQDIKYIIISLEKENHYSQYLKERNIEVHYFNFSKSIFNNIFEFIKIFKLIKQLKPNITHSWLYYSDLINSIISKINKTKSIWSIRGMEVYSDSNNLIHKLTIKILSFLAKKVPSKIISCSERAAESFIKIGYPKEIVVIPNGYDFKKFNNDKKRKYYSKKNVFVIGNVGRFHPHKDHANLVHAINILKQLTNKNFKLVLIGRNIDHNNTELIDLIKKLNLIKNVDLLGKKNNIEDYYAKFDLFVLSSFTEGFPNVILEAMASGVPCVSTNVGDVPLIIGETGKIVPVNDPILLANAILEMMESSRLVDFGAMAQKRVSERFTIEKMIDEYENIYKSC